MPEVKPLASFILSLVMLLLTNCTSAPDPKPAAPDPKPATLPAGHPPVEGITPDRFHNQQAEAYAAYMYGLILASEGRNREAIGYLQMSSKFDTASIQILDDLMKVYMQEGMHTEAEATALEVLRRNPQWADAHILLGQLYLDMDRLIEAINHLEIALELEPDKINVLFYLADALERSGDLDRAIESLQELARSEDHKAIAHYYIARLHLRAGNMDIAADYLFKAVELNPSFAREIPELTGYLEKNGKEEEVILFQRKYLERDPDNSLVREMLARSLLAEKRYQEARTEADLVLKAEPDNVAVKLLVGLIEAHEENFERALEIFNQVRMSAPDNFELILQIGVLQRQLEMYPESIKTFQAASGIASDRYEPHLNISIVYDLTDDRDKAIESARTALALQPDRASIRTYLAQLLLKEDLFQDSKEILKQGLSRTPDDTGMLYQLAIAYDRSGGFDMAVDVLKRIIEIDPGHYDALNYLGYSWADRDMNLDQSLDLIQKALAIKPDAAYIIDSLGWVYYRMGRYEEALEHLLDAGEKMEGDATVLEHIGDTYDKLGKRDQAVEFWLLALKADPGNERVQEKLKDKRVIETTP